MTTLVWPAIRTTAPSGRKGLFRAATSVLLAEPNRDRDSAPEGPLALAISGRIATLLLLCNRTKISIDDGIRAHSDEVLELSQIADGSPEVVEGSAYPVTPDLVRAVLSRPMFEATAEHIVTFRHRGLMEHVAATYLAGRNPPSALRAIVSAEGAIVPQLHGLAGNLLALDLSFFDLLLQDDNVPVTLYLNCDLLDLDEARRQSIVRRLIQFSTTPMHGAHGGATTTTNSHTGAAGNAARNSNESSETANRRTNEQPLRGSHA